MLRQTLRAAVTLFGEAISIRFAAHRERTNFTVSGQSIPAWFYYHQQKSRLPGVLVLSTASGLTAHEHAFAVRLAREGYIALVIAYTRRTTGAAVMSHDLQRQHLEQIVVAGWRLLQANEAVDPKQTAVIGFSLGGYFASYLAAAVKEYPPQALAIYYGMYALAGSELMRLSTPLLLMQGEDDDEDFVTNARRVSEIATRDGKPWQVVWYPAAEHQFDLFSPRGAAARDAWRRTITFLRQNLAV